MHLPRILLVFLSLSFVFTSCQKEEFRNVESETLIVNQTNYVLTGSEKLFFDINKPIPNVISVRNEIDSIVYVINNLLLQLNQQEPFANEFIANIGIPYWNATLVEKMGESFLVYTPVVSNDVFIGLLVFSNSIETDQVYMTYSVKSFNESYGAILGSDYPIHSILDYAYEYYGYLNITSEVIEVRGEGCKWVYEGINCESPGCPRYCDCEGERSNPECCYTNDCLDDEGDYDNGSNSDDDNDSAGGGININTWINIVNTNWYNGKTGKFGNFSNGSTDEEDSNDNSKVRILQEISDEQLVIGYLLDWLESMGVIVSEDGSNSEYAQLLQNNPQIASAIYKYLQGYYDGVVVVQQHALDLLTLLIDHGFELSGDQIEHILTFEPELIADIDAFLDNHPNDPLALQIVIDFINLQNAGTTNTDPSFGDIDYDNDFEFIYGFYNNMSSTNTNWLSISTVYLNEHGLDMPIFEFMELYENNCVLCSVEGFEEDVIKAFVESVTDFDIEDIDENEDIDGMKIKLLECHSFEWTQVGQGWVSCLDPHVMSIDIPGTEVHFALDLGCLSYTVPKTRADENGVIYQWIEGDEASSCASIASNLSSLSVKLAINVTHPGNLNSTMTKWFMANIYKESFRNWMTRTSCGYGAIASCNDDNCPGGTREPSYTDDFISVTEESLLGECH